MLYSTGGVTVWVGCVTSYVGTLSSKKITQRTNVINVYPASTANSATVTTNPVNPLPIPAAVGNGNTVLQQAVQNIVDQVAQQQAQDPTNDQSSKPQDPSNPAIFSYSSNPNPVAPMPINLVSQNTINISRPVVINAVNLFYLGTGKLPPRVIIRRRFRPIYQSDSGRVIEYDKCYAGQDAMIRMVLNNWNEYTYSIIAARVNQRSVGGGPRGVDTMDSIGSMMLTEGLAYMLFLQYPNSGKPMMASGGMPAGYRFFAAYPLTEEMQPGLVANNLVLDWHALKLYDFNTGNQWLFDNDMSLIPQLSPSF